MFIYFERLLNSPLAVVPASLVLCGLLVMPAVAVQEPGDPDPDEIECPYPLPNPDDYDTWQEYQHDLEAELQALCTHLFELLELLYHLHGMGDFEDYGAVACCTDDSGTTRKYPCVWRGNIGDHLLPLDDNGVLDEACFDSIVHCIFVHEIGHIEHSREPWKVGSCPETDGGPSVMPLDPSAGTTPEASMCEEQAGECHAYTRELVCLDTLQQGAQGVIPRMPRRYCNMD